METAELIQHLKCLRTLVSSVTYTAALTEAGKRLVQNDSLIAQQARHIAEQDERLRINSESFRVIHMILSGIGGPLNDNKLAFTREQMKPFGEIAAEIGS